MKKNLFALLHATSVLRLIAWLNRHRVTVLCYHGVTNQSGLHSHDPHRLHLQRERFIQHLDYLQSHHRIVSLADFVQARRNHSELPAGAVVLTFEDGFRNFFSVVAPILLERGIPATSFIVTSPEFTRDASESDAGWRLKDDDSYMSWDEVRQLAARGIEFGSHTSTHVPLSEISPLDAESELRDSLNALQQALGLTNVPLSYPHGKTSEVVNEIAKAAGYYCALTTTLGQNENDCDLFALKRTVISADDDVYTFAARLSGLTWRWGQFRNLKPSWGLPESVSNQPTYDRYAAGNTES